MKNVLISVKYKFSNIFFFCFSHKKLLYKYLRTTIYLITVRKYVHQQFDKYRYLNSFP